MPSTIYQLPLKTTATMAAADTNDTAVALTEPSAAFVSFQRHQPGIPLTQNVNSAPRSLTAACQFSGSIAISAAIAVTTATFTTF
jgi:hypothetical protein